MMSSRSADVELCGMENVAVERARAEDIVADFDVGERDALARFGRGCRCTGLGGAVAAGSAKEATTAAGATTTFAKRGVLVGFDDLRHAIGSKDGELHVVNCGDAACDVGFAEIFLRFANVFRADGHQEGGVEGVGGRVEDAGGSDTVTRSEIGQLHLLTLPHDARVCGRDNVVGLTVLGFDGEMVAVDGGDGAAHHLSAGDSAARRALIGLRVGRLLGQDRLGGKREAR